MTALGTASPPSNPQYLLLKNHSKMLSDTENILIDIPPHIYSQLRQFALDNNIVTAVTGFPKVASAVEEMEKIFEMCETNEELLLLDAILGFPIMKWCAGEELKLASTIEDIVHIFLAIHAEVKLQVGDSREVLGGTTLELLSCIFEAVITIYRVEGIRGHNIGHFISKTAKDGGDPIKEMTSFFIETLESIVLEYVRNMETLSIEEDEC